MERRAHDRQDLVVVGIGFGLVIAVGAFFLFRGDAQQGGRDTEQPASVADSTKRVPYSTPEDVRAYLVKSPSLVTVVDTRSDDQFRIAHAAGSRREVDSQAILSFPVAADGVLLLIPSGSEQTDAAINAAMTGAGFRYSFMKDGLAGWQAAGGAVVTEPDMTSPIDRSKVTVVAPDAWKALLSGPVPYRVLDAREVGGSAASPVPNALNVPYAEFETRRDEIPSATNIALCAGSPEDAFRAAVRLFDLGYYAVKTLDGSCADVMK